MILAYLSGLMSSSFAISDSNLLVSTVSAIVFIATLLFTGHIVLRKSTPRKVIYCLITGATYILGFVLSIKDIV